MKTKNITIEDLAGMVQKGFQETNGEMKKGFKEVNERLDRIENIILKQHAGQIESLEKRISHLEETLAVK